MSTKIYFRAYAVFWLIFGLIATFFPVVLNLFLSEQGIAATTPFSNHVWMHGGIDILSLTVVLFALSTMNNVPKIVTIAVAIAALGPTAAIFQSLFFTEFWTYLFLVTGISTLMFSIWGFLIAAKS